ncbi:hypothetical protein M2451_002963 [Dysgonomonas sp. PFB1-18]|uniref:SIR2 family protein n=1 Tax=unclassified Dysgonomonas TaxID=2630389 RepID=UPI0013D4590B|nr:MULTISPECIES: SIR2 family protein [unclassified Dysgonomonas]MDH6310073.1 hypothetical protein [Dysgonomonas sp. PF1-14]MDH6339982.1 hypothetical protein [Dysgonomonas sp. PF1-16]MDH6381630.1 hypothetical protein [Dysgonomonas sp. PFB1-18]MDH6398732.1 hypothetical protein [Dysgonomonas sp. PF1-23]NDV93579.1 hypothetical protein [Dysgonomonas sp. 521]
MNDLLQKFIKQGNIVIVAGAGISKEKPASLPSWWEYNLSLFREIGNLGAEILCEKNNLLDDLDIEKFIPVISISDFIFNYVAGKAYFPLLEVLEGSSPNKNHIFLAELAERKKIKAIVTTNFDTLIEQAFLEQNIPVNVFYDPLQFDNIHESENIHLYKIHGSVTNTSTAVDLVTQKIGGLSIGKYNVLKKIFSENHIIFLGFSGEDFSFNIDYLPLSFAQYGVTWVVYPNSPIPDVVSKLKDSVSDFVFEEATLPEFYCRTGWENIYSSIYINQKEEETLKPTIDINKKIRSVLNSQSITQWSCLGMCIQLFKSIGNIDRALHISRIIDYFFKEKLSQENMDKNNINGYILLPIIEKLSIIPRNYFSLSSVYISDIHYLVPLFDTLGDVFKETDIHAALEYYYLSLKISNKRLAQYVDGSYDLKKDIIYNNISTTLGRIGTLCLEQNHYKDAVPIFREAAYDALSAKRFYNFSCMYFYAVYSKNHNILKHYSTTENIELYIAELNVCMRLAEQGGHCGILFAIHKELFVIYHIHGFSKNALISKEKAELYAKMSIDRNIKLNELENINSSLPETPYREESYFKIWLYREPDNKYVWKEAGEREILRYEEGIKAYSLFREKQYEDAILLLEQTSNKYLTKHDFESNLLSEMFSFAAVHLRFFTGCYSPEEMKLHLNRCIKLEIKCGLTDYLVLSTHYYSIILSEKKLYEDSLFYAQLGLSVCDNPIEHSVILGLCLNAAKCCICLKKYSDTKYYIDKYYHYSSIVPDFVDPIGHEYAEQILKDIIKINNPT